MISCPTIAAMGMILSIAFDQRGVARTSSPVTLTFVAVLQVQKGHYILAVWFLDRFQARTRSAFPTRTSFNRRICSRLVNLVISSETGLRTPRMYDHV